MRPTLPYPPPGTPLGASKLVRARGPQHESCRHAWVPAQSGHPLRGPAYPLKRLRCLGHYHGVFVVGYKRVHAQIA